MSDDDVRDARDLDLEGDAPLDAEADADEQDSAEADRRAAENGTIGDPVEADTTTDPRDPTTPVDGLE